ncbi:predicted protein [Chaetoceros tenuissimus]|uniref:Uncharacterized protein n=1 Tax=Chaetoceros tenuissimus TaxID=426638 RepID=A0AAD3CX54_9STRA|nr:predicted protein [Chaetoceros tenuissimus]
MKIVPAACLLLGACGNVSAFMQPTNNRNMRYKTQMTMSASFQTTAVEGRKLSPLFYNPEISQSQQKKNLFRGKNSRKALFTAALSTTLITQGNVQPAYAAKTATVVEAETDTTSSNKAIPIAITAGGIAIAKKLLSDKDDDEDKEALLKMMNAKVLDDAKKDVDGKSDELKKIAHEREERRLARERMREKEAKKIADDLKLEQASTEIKVESVAPPVIDLEKEERIAEEARKKVEEKKRIEAEQKQKEAAAKAEAEKEAAELKAKEEEEAAAKAKAEQDAAAEKKAKEEEEAAAKAKAEQEAAELKAKEEEEAAAKAKAEQEAAKIEEVVEEQEQAVEEPPAPKDYNAISDPGQRAFEILVDLGLVELTPDPKSPSYDRSKDNDFV